MRIAGERVGSCARTATNLLEFARAAFSFQPRCIAQGAEDRRVAIDFRKGLPADAARRKGQESAWEYLTGVRDENAPFAVIEPTRRAPDRILYAAGRLDHDACLTVSDSLLQRVTTIVLRLSGLNVEPRSLRKLIDLCEHPLEFVGIEQIVELAAARGDEEEHRP